MPLRIGHRGAGGLAPENTLAAFNRAVREGVDLVECDVRSSGDGTLFVFHDESLRRLTGHDLKLSEASADFIRAEVRVAGEHPIPTLSELCLFLAKFPHVGLFVEIKEEAVAEATLRILRSEFAAGRLVVGSFSREAVRMAADAGGGIHAIQLATDNENYGENWWTRPRFGIAGLPFRKASAERVRELKGRGLDVWVWTVNSVADIEVQTRNGVDGIISDRPDFFHPLDSSGNSPRRK